MNEVNQFLKDTERFGPGTDILEQPLYPQPTGGAPTGATGEDESEPTGPTGPAGEEEAEDGEGEPIKAKPRNRRERRLLAKLEAERQSSMQLAQRLQTMSGAQQSIENAEYLKGIERIYGTDSPEAQMATELLRNALIGMGKDAEERAYQRIVAERQQAAQAEAEAQAELDGFIDEIEDTYGVELSETQERSYFQLLHKMSPKDKNGNVIGYADPHAVWEVFQERTKKKPTGNNRAKNLVNRSMNQGGAPDNSKIQEDSTVRFLKDSGII